MISQTKAWIKIAYNQAPRSYVSICQNLNLTSSILDQMAKYQTYSSQWNGIILPMELGKAKVKEIQVEHIFSNRRLEIKLLISIQGSIKLISWLEIIKWKILFQKLFSIHKVITRKLIKFQLLMLDLLRVLIS